MYPVEIDALGILYANNKSLSAFGFASWPVGPNQIVFSFQLLNG